MIKTLKVGDRVYIEGTITELNPVKDRFHITFRSDNKVVVLKQITYYSRNNGYYGIMICEDTPVEI